MSRQRVARYVILILNNYLTQTLQDPPKKGYYQSVIILKTFAIHFGSLGVNIDPVLLESLPVGALALAAVAVSPF